MPSGLVTWNQKRMRPSPVGKSLAQSACNAVPGFHVPIEDESSFGAARTGNALKTVHRVDAPGVVSGSSVERHPSVVTPGLVMMAPPGAGVGDGVSVGSGEFVAVGAGRVGVAMVAVDDGAESVGDSDEDVGEDLLSQAT